MNFLNNLLKLGKWYAIVLYVGIGFMFASIYFKINFIEEKHLFGLGVGMFMIGISFFKAEKGKSAIKPPNAYTGGALLFSWKEIRHNPVTKFLLIIGVLLCFPFGFLIIKSLV